MSVIRKALSILLVIVMVAATPVGVSADPGLNGSGEEAAVSDASAAKVSEAAGKQAAPIDLVPVGMEETGIADEPSAGSSENEEHITDAAEKTDNIEPASLSDTEEGEAFSDPSAEEAGGLAEEEGVSALHGEDAGIPENSEGDPGESRYLIETDDYAIDENGTVLIKTNTAVIGEAHRNLVKSVTFAEGVDTLTTWALYHCPNLSYVELPEGFKELNSYSLGWCGLKVVVLPATLETLRAATFDYCSDLTLVVFRGAAPQTYGAAIRNLSPRICYCPSDNWTESARTAIAATGNWVPVTDTFMSFHADRMAAAGRLIETYEAVIANPHNDKEKAGYLMALKNALTSLAETEDRDAIDSVLKAGLAALSEDIFIPYSEGTLYINDVDYSMTEDHSGGNWTYNARLGQLNLTNWSGSYLEATADCNIILSGENTITPAATSRCAVKAGGNLSIDAADDSTVDSLKIIQPEGCSETFIGIDPGWSSGGKLSLMGGTIDIRLRDISGSFGGSYGIYGWNGEITEGSDAVLKVTAEEGSTKVDGLYIVRFKISGGTTIVDVPGTASLDFTMDGGDVTLKGETAIHYRDVDAAFYINSGAGTLTLDGRILSCEGMVPVIAPDHRITEPEGSIFIKADGMLVPADPDTLEEITSMVVSPVIDSGMVITDSPYFDVSATFGESYTGANLRGAVTGCGTHRLDFTLKEGSELPEGLRLTGNQSTGSVYLYGTPTANYKAQDVTFIITDYATEESGELTIRIGEIIDPETPIINVTGVSLAGSSIVDEDGVKIICLPSNGRADIAAFVEPAGAQDQNTTLLGGDADIATAWWSDNNGTISWHGEGITTFTVRTEQGNKTDSVKVYAAAYLAYIRTDQAALTNLIPGRCYLIEGVEHRADENGEIPYEAAWSDKTVSIILRSDIDPRCNSTAQNVDIPDLSNVLPADYTAVTEALARVPADLSVYTEETASAVQAAVSAVREGLKIGRQAEVDAMAAAINEAVASLTIKVVETPRIYGSNRYATSLAIADRLKAAYGVSKYKAVVVATGENYPDALAGGYLAIQKKAPIILIRAKDKDKKAVIAYIKANLEKKGTVYVLGGEPAVPAAWIKDLTAKSSGFTVKRLAGKNRYLTNIAILKEAGVRKGAEILVATGTDFPDALCASALNKPLLIVKTSLSTAQKNYLNTLKGSKFYILGPTSKVSSGVEKALKPYGAVRRVGTSTNVFTRSVQIAREFAPAPNAVALAYSDKYPDGLCGGVLASTAKAPLLLVRDGKTAKAAEYFETYGATEGMTFGSASVISDKTIFSIIKNATHIKAYTR